MFGHRLGHSPTEPQLLPPERFQPSVQLRCLLLQKRIARLAIYYLMKPLVFEVIFVRITRIHCDLALGICVDEVFQSLIRYAQSRKATADGFNLGHDLEHFQKLDRARLPDKGTPSRDKLHKTRQCKPLNCFPKWCSGNAELIGQLDFIQAISIRESTVKDQFFQILSNRIC